MGAVSKLRMVSCVDGDEGGNELMVEGGSIGAVRPASRGVGTTVEVSDLFYNTPVRRRHLKSESAELRQISQLLQAYALARPDVHFSFKVEGRITLDIPTADDLHGRMGQVFGMDRLRRMVPILIEADDLSLEGFLGAPENSRVRSGHQMFLINGRWVNSFLLRTAVREAYGDLIPQSRHPEAVLHLRLAPEEVDVNVHPTKREVRLLRERMLYPRLIALLREQVEGRFPTLNLRQRPEEPDRDPGRSQIPMGLYLSRPAPGGDGRVAEKSNPPALQVFPFPGNEEKVSEDTEEGDDLAPAMASMWQVHETYILAAIEGGILIIDQHAAHERVLFEQAMGRLLGDPATSQELLFPLVVDLTHDELAVLLEINTTLEKLGFHLELFGGTSVLVHAIPTGFREWRHGALMKDVLDHYTDLQTGTDVQERVARSVACQGAVKAGQKLSLEEMNSLVDQLFATEKPQGDPHGRPVFLRMELDELHRRFGRSS